MDSSNFKSAANAYLNGDYQSAADIYTELESDQASNPFIEINLGNAHYKLNNYGKAIKSYYQAKKIIPRNKEVNNNLSIVLNEVKLDQPAMMGFNVLNITESLILVLVFNLLFIFRNKLQISNLFKTIISIVFMLTIINLSFVAYEQRPQHYAVITQISTKAYSGDNDAYSELFELLDGQIIEIVRPGKKWSQIRYDGALGWVSNDSFEQI